MGSSISNTDDRGQVKNQIARALVDRIIGAARSGHKFKVSSLNKPILGRQLKCG